MGPGAEFTSSGGADVADGQVEDLEDGVVGGEVSSGLGDFPQLIVE